MMLALSLFVVVEPAAARARRRQIDPENAARPSTSSSRPTTRMRDLLATTLAAAKAMDYPGRQADRLASRRRRHRPEVQLAEASPPPAPRRHAAPSCRRFARASACNYLTRARNEHAKAGNLNNGLEHSTGELVAVFDADHAPARRLPDGDGRLLRPRTRSCSSSRRRISSSIPTRSSATSRTFETMPSENEMFYGVIQRGLDKWNAAFFCGSAAVLQPRGAAGDRRLQRHQHHRGLRDRARAAFARLEQHLCRQAADRRPAAGRPSPASSASARRWAQGMMQILRFRFPPLQARPDAPAAPLLHVEHAVLAVPVPARHLPDRAALLPVLLLEIFTASGGEFLAYTLTYMIVNLMMQNYLYGRFRWPWISELYEYVQTIHLLPAVLSVIAQSAQADLQGDGQGRDRSTRAASRSSARPFFIIFGILLLGVVATGGPASGPSPTRPTSPWWRAPGTSST